MKIASETIDGNLRIIVETSEGRGLSTIIRGTPDADALADALESLAKEVREAL